MAECSHCAYGQQEDVDGMLYVCSTCTGTGRIVDDVLPAAAPCPECSAASREDLADER